MSDTQQIKDNLDIVDFVGEYVQLKPAGSNHKGLCPFHNEKSPSFMVSRERQSWRCFGCNKGGDIFSFVQDIEGMEFVEALKFLADKAGVTLARTFEGNKQAGEQKVRLKAVMEEAVRFYHQFLLKMDTAADARAYLTDRGLQDYTMDVWKIGFVPDQWDLLTKYLLKKGFAIDDLVDAGLTIKRDGADRASGKGYYDRFRGRVMFPIHDAHGSAVGVTGRVLVETEKSGGKYVNTPQTPVYDKSRLLYGLDKAKKAIRDADEVVVVEGQMDVISVWQSGMENIVASSGTALTEHQIKLMKRYTKNIAMAFDTDAAGLKAAKRGIGLALEAGMRVRVIQIPEDIAKDPDECVKSTPEVWQESVRHAKDVLAWYIDLALSQHDIHTPHGKQSIANDVLPEIARIPYAVERDHWLGELALRTGVDRSVLKEDLARITADAPKQRSAPTPTTSTPPVAATPVDTTLTRIVKEWLALVLTYPEIQIGEMPVLSASIALPEPLSSLYKQVQTMYTAQHRIDVTQLTDDALVSELTLLGAHHFDSVDEKGRQTALTTLTERIQTEVSTASRSVLIQELAAAEQAGDTVRVTEILSQLQ